MWKMSTKLNAQPLLAVLTDTKLLGGAQKASKALYSVPFLFILDITV